MAVKRLQNYINGEWVDSTTDEFVEIINPARGELLCECPMSTRAELDSAIQAAQEAYPDWRNTPPVARARYLHRLIELLEDNFNELSVVQTTEHGHKLNYMAN